MNEKKPKDSDPKTQAPTPDAKKAWPISWVLILVLAYMLFQVAWIAFGSKR